MYKGMKKNVTTWITSQKAMHFIILQVYLIFCGLIYV